MSWLGLDHFVAVKAALGAQAAAARFLDVGGKTSAAQAEDSVEMADADDAADTAPIVFHLVYEDAAGNHRNGSSPSGRSRPADRVIPYCAFATFVVARAASL